MEEIKEIKDMIAYPCQLSLIETRIELGKDELMSVDVNTCQVYCPIVDRGIRFKYLAKAETSHDKIATLLSLMCSRCEYRRELEDVKHGRRECE